MKRILLIKRMLLSWYLLHLDNKRNLTIDTIVSMFPRTGGAKQVIVILTIKWRFQDVNFSPCGFIASEFQRYNIDDLYDATLHLY